MNMTLRRKRILTGMLTTIMTVMMLICSTAMSAFADDVVSSKTDPKGALTQYIDAGGKGGKHIDDVFYRQDGGSYKYSELVKDGVVNGNFEELKSSEKNKLLNTMYDISQEKVSSDANITTGTQDNWLKDLQNCNGVGSQLMNTLLKNTKPDYATANHIYTPFSGIVGTVLALIAILLMAFLGITMALDLSYIGIPAFRMICDGDGEGKGGQGKPKFISYEAVSAVQLAEGGQGGGGQNGSSNKVAVGVYFKRRVIMLIALGICLLYLIQGQIFTLVSWILDLVSGFFGF